MSLKGSFAAVTAFLLTLLFSLAHADAPVTALTGWSLSPEAEARAAGAGVALTHKPGREGPLRLDRTVHLEAGTLAVVRLTASVPAGAKLTFDGDPGDTHYPLGSSQLFAVQPLPTPIVAVLPAATDGDCRLHLSADKDVTIQASSVTTGKPDWLVDSAMPTLHAAGVPALPAHWANTGGKYLRSLGGTVAFQLTPTWITALKGGRGGIFDAYVALRMTADKKDWTTYFMIQPPGTDADNATWERSHWKLDQPLLIGDSPDTGWAPAASRLDDGKDHFVAFSWKQFRLNDANYLYTSYFVDDRPYNARVTFLGDQTVAPDPKALWLGSLGGQPAGYDGSPPAPLGAKHLLVYRDVLSPRGLLALRRQLQAGTGPAVTVEASGAPPVVTDSPLPNRVVNGSFALGGFGWGGRFVDTIAGHPHGSWHGQPGTSIGVNEVWRAHGGRNGRPGLVFTLPQYADKPLESDAFVLPPGQRFRLTFSAHSDTPGAGVTVELKRHGPGEPTIATAQAGPDAAWGQAYGTPIETTPGESDWYSLVVTAHGPGGGRIAFTDVSLAGAAGRSLRAEAEASVGVGGAEDGLVTDAAPVPLVVRIARSPAAARAPLLVRLRMHDFFGRVFYDKTRTLPTGVALFKNETLAWPIPVTIHGLCRARVDVRGPWGSSVAECPVTIVDHRIAESSTEADSFFGSEWFPSDQANGVSRRLGLKWIKMMNVGTGYGWWNMVETSPGRFTYGSTPGLIATHPFMKDVGDRTDFVERLRALRKQGVLPMVTLVGAPAWENEEQASTGDNPHASFPRDMAAWSRAVRAIVGHYKGLVPAYEIWNEPGWWDNNQHLQKTKTYSDYARLVQTAITAIRETDPHALIVYQYYFNKMTDDDKALQKKILKQVDVISTHNYFNDLPPDEDGTEDFFADMQKEVRASGNPHLQLWNTEGGVRAGGWHPYRAPDTLPFPRPVPFETERRGAQLAKADIEMLAHGYSKYFFYISGGPVGGRADFAPDDYSAWAHWGSYGTPTVAGGVSAVYAGLLHGAKYVKTIEKNPRVRFYVFQTPTGALTFYWGRNFGKEGGDLRLASAKPPAVLDMMGNPVALAPARPGRFQLPLTNLVNSIRTPTVAEAERLVGILQLRALPGNDFDTTLATPFTEKFAYAQTLAGEQWYQVDLTGQANRGFADDVAGDGRGGWTDEGPDNDLRYLPTGLLTLYGVPFRVIDPAGNGGRSCIVLRAGPGPGTRTNRNEYPRSVTIPVGRRTNVFYFLLGVGWGVDGDVATLTVRYADGQAARIPLRDGVNVANWHDQPLPNTDDHKFVPARKDRFLYAVQWVNPRPGVRIQGIDFTSANGTPIPILLSVTGHGAD